MGTPAPPWTLMLEPGPLIAATPTDRLDPRAEFARRLEAAGLGDAAGDELPMTQEQLADALGITPVHVNRILKDLDREGLVVRNKSFVRVPNWAALRKAGGFNELYLHLDQALDSARRMAS